MADKKTYALSVYLIKKDLLTPEDILSKKDGEKEIPGIGMFYRLQTRGKQPSWLNLFNGSGIDPLYSSSVSALLLMKVENRFLALTFGPGGRHFLKKGVTEERFGLITTLNSVEVESLKSVDTKTLESEGIQTRIQSSKPIGTDEFGFDIEKDLVRSIVGKSNIEALGETLVGKDSLRLSVKCDINDLKEILKICLEQHKKLDYQKKFPWIDNLKEIKDINKIEELNSHLIAEFNETAPQKLWLAVPEILEWADHGYFKYKKAKKAAKLDDVHVSTFKDSLKKTTVSLEDLNKNHVFRFSMADDYEKESWPIYDCIYFEFNQEGSTFFLTGGKWYEVNTNIVTTVNTNWRAIPKDTHGINFIDYNHDDENKYNVDLAKANDALCMDGKNIPIEGRSKFEFCDVYSKNRILIHTKRYAYSAVLSHLFNQGYVSAEMLFDPDSRRKINKELSDDFAIKDEYNQPNTNGEDYTVIFAIVSNDKGAFDMPFFSKMTLASVAKNLKNRGYKISVVIIQNLKKDTKE